TQTWNGEVLSGGLHRTQRSPRETVPRSVSIDRDLLEFGRAELPPLLRARRWFAPHLSRKQSPRQSRYLQVYQGNELLAAVHIAITEFTLRKRPWDAEFESKRILAFEKPHLLDGAAVEFGKSCWIQRSGILDAPIACEVGEQNVEGEYEGTCILATNQRCDIS